MVQKERLVQTFCKLVSFDSPSYGERSICNFLTETLTALGLQVREDHAAQKIQGNAGNLYAYLPATKGMEQLPPLLFSGHMDTVEPSKGKKAIVHADGTITSDGTTVLGADDCSALTAILEALAVIQENHLLHRAIEVLFSVAEETYCIGASVFDFSQIQSKEAYVLDLTGAVGGAAIQAPTLLSFRISVTGKASHAGFHPEQGIHAICVAASAARRLKNGWLDENTTRNIGTIHGGTQTNIVPASCVVTGEIRSFDHEQAMRTWEETKHVFEEEARKLGAAVSARHTVHIHAYQTPEQHPVVQRFQRVCAKHGIASQLCSTMGGSDNNPLSEHGLTGMVLATAMNNCHSCEEYSNVDELEKVAAITVDLMCSEE